MSVEHPYQVAARRDRLPGANRPDGSCVNVRFVLAIGAAHCVPATLKFSRLPKWSRNAARYGARRIRWFIVSDASAVGMFGSDKGA